MNVLVTGLHPETSVPEPDASTASRSAEGMLAAAMAESNATRGAVVSIDGHEVRVEVAEPDTAWLRSVDLYIARELLLRRGVSARPCLSASDRSYIVAAATHGTAVLILSEP